MLDFGLYEQAAVAACFLASFRRWGAGDVGVEFFGAVGQYRTVAERDDTICVACSGGEDIGQRVWDVALAPVVRTETKDFVIVGNQNRVVESCRNCADDVAGCRYRRLTIVIIAPRDDGSVCTECERMIVPCRYCDDATQ